MAKLFKTIFKLRRGESKAWDNNNPLLAYGEPGYDKDKNILKIGDGERHWKELDPIGDAKARIDKLIENGQIGSGDPPGMKKVFERTIDTSKWSMAITLTDTEQFTFKENQAVRVVVDWKVFDCYFGTFEEWKNSEGSCDIECDDWRFPFDQLIIHCSNENGVYTATKMEIMCNQNWGNVNVSFEMMAIDEAFQAIDPKYLPEGGFGYTEGEKKVILEETEFTTKHIEYEGVYGSIEATLDIFAGDKVIVVWDGIEYECIVYSYSTSSSLIIGDRSAASSHFESTTGEPFCLSYSHSYPNKSLIISAEVDKGSITGSTHTIKIIKLPTAHVIDEKFMPYNIPNIQVAKKGQTAIVKTVDENGKPTRWEVVDRLTMSELTESGQIGYETYPFEKVAEGIQSPGQDCDFPPLPVETVLRTDRAIRVTINKDIYDCHLELTSQHEGEIHSDNKDLPMKIFINFTTQTPLNNTTKDYAISGYVIYAGVSSSDIDQHIIIESASGLIIYPMDPKYLPDTIATKADIFGAMEASY